MPLRAHDIESGVIARYPTQGSNGTWYTQTLYGSGFWGCDCPDWANRRAKLEDHTTNAPAENHCKHIRDNAMPLWRDGRVPLQFNPVVALTGGRPLSQRASALRRGEEV